MVLSRCSAIGIPLKRLSRLGVKPGVILRVRVVRVPTGGSPAKIMTVAASFDRTGHYPLRMGGGGSTWARLTILTGLVAADLICFAVADKLLHMFAQPPAL